MFGQSFRQLCTVAARSVSRPNVVRMEIGLFRTTWKSQLSITPRPWIPTLPWDGALQQPEGPGEVKMELDSVMRKRKKKMKKHKLRKRRKREKAEKRKLSQGR
ncbi:hypothetical protein HG536_0B05200 [Torulaspora globosa]|uniref:Ribosomal protein mS38 C-terminal domain-containing protein n=1 Tax=Torulaspora globosa TaxID=48254 RepID=A0A7G3ZDR9_9SACH|nr:uncharacterized protein HG536_0B05200 [Torulaspora globosa]QLL31655.1 hypothetical protein HG536_0B05200 [Torulaspora globosa]